tara:strand:- start:70 stop:531 length:462 start_codon:yes stop_codon:yes gene_type:complete
MENWKKILKKEEEKQEQEKEKEKEELKKEFEFEVNEIHKFRLELSEKIKKFKKELSGYKIKISNLMVPAMLGEYFDTFKWEVKYHLDSNEIKIIVFNVKIFKNELQYNYKSQHYDSKKWVLDKYYHPKEFNSFEEMMGSFIREFKSDIAQLKK